MLLKASPTSLKVTMRAIQKGSTLNLSDCLKMEYRLACTYLNRTSDFCEGAYICTFIYKCIFFPSKQLYFMQIYKVYLYIIIINIIITVTTGVRALLIDKDQKPMWNPNSLREVTDAYVNQKFTKLLEEKELQL